jgi:hypothetical protein
MASISSCRLGNVTFSSKGQATRSPYENADVVLYHLALRNAQDSVRHLQDGLSLSKNRTELSLAYRELAIHLRDVGHLLALSAEPAVSSSILDIPQLLTLSTHMLAICETGSFDILAEDVLESVTQVSGALFSSYCGIEEMMCAFEDTGLEQAWFSCLLGDGLPEHKWMTELRRRPGPLSLAEEVQKSSLDIEISPLVVPSKLDIAIATATLLDGWRTSQIILQLQLGDMEHIRRHFEIVSRACLQLAKLCTYDSGREVWSTMSPRLRVGSVCRCH